MQISKFQSKNPTMGEIIIRKLCELLEILQINKDNQQPSFRVTSKEGSTTKG